MGLPFFYFFLVFLLILKMSQIDFKKQIKLILSKQKDFEEKLDVIIKDLRKYLANRGKAFKLYDKPSQKKTKKKVKFVCGKL
jgi:CRISPR/Cas system Type II protein with McrA/HNH and RuvC-like nuclease domain